MTGLEPTAAHAMRALADARTPSDGATERAWLLMQERIVDGPPPLDVATTMDPRQRARWIAVGVAVAAVLVVAIGVGSWRAGWLATVDGRTPAEAPYSTTRDEALPDTATMPAPEPTPVAPLDTPPTNVVAPDVADPDEVAETEIRSRPSRTKPRRAPEPTTVQPAPRTTTLAAEMRLLAKANSAMRAGDPAGALRVLDEHRRDYPSGQLAPERDYKRAVATCELGRGEEARSIAAAFLRAHPKSPLRSKAESVCSE